MTKTEFKKAFGSTAESYGFRRIYSCWITESPERIFVLMLQKSNFGNYYDLVIKIFIQGGIWSSLHIGQKHTTK